MSTSRETATSLPVHRKPPILTARPINKYEYFLWVFLPLQTRSARLETSYHSCISLARRNSRQVFLLGFNTLFYMLPCLLRLIIFSLFWYTGKKPTHGWEKNSSLQCNTLFSTFSVLSYPLLRDKRREFPWSSSDDVWEAASMHFLELYENSKFSCCRDWLVPVLTGCAVIPSLGCSGELNFQVVFQVIQENSKRKHIHSKKL